MISLEDEPVLGIRFRDKEMQPESSIVEFYSEEEEK